jgi:hypothetical protein
MSGITLEGKLYMIEQERTFKGEDVVRFLKHLMRQIPGKLLVVWDGSPIHRGGAVKDFQSRTFWRAGRPGGLNWSNYPVMLLISILMRECGSTSSVWS